MIEDAEQRSSKYLDTTTQSLNRVKRKKLSTSVSQDQVDKMMELVRGYTKDAKHYLERKKPVTSLACIAYAEGLLDGLRFLELIDF
jgi:FAD synthetase